MYTVISINGSSGSCHPSRDAELIPICNRLLTDLHVIRKMKCIVIFARTAVLLIVYILDRSLSLTQGEKVFCKFVDFKSAFDLITRQELWFK